MTVGKKAMTPKQRHLGSSSHASVAKLFAVGFCLCVGAMWFYNSRAFGGGSVANSNPTSPVEPENLRGPHGHRPSVPREADHEESSHLLFHGRSSWPNACTFVNYTGHVDEQRRHFQGLITNLLSFGTRVAGSASDGYFGVMAALSEMLACPPAPAANELTEEAKDISVVQTPPLTPSRWVMSFDNFSAPTPLGVKTFSNLISVIENPFFVNGDVTKLDRTRRRRFPTGKALHRIDHLVLAAHWDSKLMDDQPVPFLGACDSVVPMVIILELMKLVSATLAQATFGKAYYRALARNRLPKKITVMFFDGEEAFVEWKDNDHTYGSRHLAQVWKDKGAMDDVDLFVLMDLMGPPKPVFHNYFPVDSGAFYYELRSAEQRLRHRNRLLSKPGLPMFPDEPRGFPNRVDDDHIHWLPSVPVLHLIPIPFPREWHTPQDDAAHVDISTVLDLYHITAHGLLGFPFT